MTSDESTFVGRHDELVLLGQRAEAASKGDPSVVVISGPAGAGKSALVREVRRRTPEWTKVSVEGDVAAVDVSMYAVQRLRGVLSATPLAAAAEVLEHLALQQADGPVMFVIEDLHWIDLASRQALLSAVRRLEGDRVLAVVTSREEGLDDRDGWIRLIDDTDRCASCRLGPLSKDEVGSLAEAHGMRLGEGAAARLHAHTGGHALYARTLLRELTLEQLCAGGPLPAPRTLAMTTVALAAAISADANELLAALAVINAATALATLSVVAMIDDPTSAVEECLSTGLIELVPGTTALTVRFVHPLFRAALYEELPPTQRHRLHLAAAQATAQPVAALLHRVAAADRTDDALADELQTVAERLSDAPLAASLLADAAALSTQPETAVERLLGAGRVLVNDHRSADLRQLVPRLEACPPSPGRDLLLGWSAWQTGDATLADELMARTAADTDARLEDRASAWLQLSMLRLTRGRGADAIASASAAIELDVLTGPNEELAWALLAAGIGLRDGGMHGLEVLDDHFPDRRGAEHPNSHVVFVAAMMCTLAGHPSEAVALFDVLAQPARIDTLSGPFGDRRAQINIMQALHRSRLGTWDRALVHAHAAIDLAIDQAQAWLIAQARGVTAIIHAGRGELDQATQQLASARRSPESHVPDTEVICRLAGAAIGRASSRPADTIAELAPLTDSQHSRLPLAASLQFWPTLIAAHLDLGQLEQAIASSQQLGQLADERRIDMTMQLLAIDARIAAARHDPALARSLFAAAVDAMTGNEDILDRIALHHSFGMHLKAIGQRRQASSQLAMARQLAVDARADPYLLRIDAEMGAVGVDEHSSGRLAVLTDRERDVVALVDSGLSNQEIADKLYVSRKAVEYHLGHVYAKLHLTSRRELRTLLHHP